MQVFTDNKKRNWTVAINVAAVIRVKAMLDIDLMDALGGQFMKKLSAEPALLGNLLYVICEREATERGISDRKFGTALVGESIAAFCALASELVAFFPEGKPDKTDKTDQIDKSDEKSTSCTSEDCWALVWNHAGVLGINPGPFTLRELCLMAKARKKDEWSRTSRILAQTFNINRNPKEERERSPDSFNPYSDKPEQSEGKIKVGKKTAFGLLKKLFVRGK